MKWLLMTFCLMALSSCLNPMKSIEPKIHDFRSSYPKNFKSYSSQGGLMNFAWAGDESKPPLVFVHGSPGSWEGWSEFLLNPSLQKEFHLIAIDRPGYGGSQKGEPEVDLRIQGQKMIEALQFNKSGKPAILVGHSLGGPLIARMAIDFPSRIKGLIFVAASVDPSLEELRWFQYLGKWFSFALPTDLKVCIQEIWALKPQLEAMEPQWSQINAKTILIHGEKDSLVDVGNIDFMQAKLNKENLIRTERISEMNHFVPWKRPDLILSAIETLRTFP